jgi:hypothetical protein
MTNMDVWRGNRPGPTRIKDGKGGEAGRVATEPLDSLAA